MLNSETLLMSQDSSLLEKRVNRRYVLKIAAAATLGTTLSGCGASVVASAVVVIPIAIEIVEILAATIGIASLTLKIILLARDLTDRLAISAKLTEEQLAKLEQGAKLLLEDADGNQFEVPFSIERFA